MLNMFALIEDENRFYVTVRLWIYYGILGTVLAAMTWGSIALYQNEEVEPVLKYIFIFCTILGYSAILKDPNGKGGRRYGLKGKLNWGANARGIFLKSLEDRITEYDWARVQKITIAENIRAMNMPVVRGIYFGGTHNASHAAMPLNHKRRVIIYFDSINKSEGKAGKLIHDNSAIRDATALPLYYGCTSTENILKLLKRYAPKNIDIEVTENLNLVKNG